MVEVAHDITPKRQKVRVAKSARLRLQSWSPDPLLRASKYPFAHGEHDISHGVTVGKWRALDGKLRNYQYCPWLLAIIPLLSDNHAQLDKLSSHPQAVGTSWLARRAENGAPLLECAYIKVARHPRRWTITRPCRRRNPEWFGDPLLPHGGEAV